MALIVDLDRFGARVRRDRELAYKLTGLASAIARFEMPCSSIDIVITTGEPIEVRESRAQADVVFSAPDVYWQHAAEKPPAAGYEQLGGGSLKGLTLKGDTASLIAPYHPAWDRLFQLLVEELRGPLARATTEPEPFKATDTAVGRYAYVDVDDVNLRIYYETAGTGPVPLLLQHTAGADSRQWRHLLADPVLQSEFTLVAYDLPYHGRSLPPTSVRWWEEPYRTTKELLMSTVVAISKTIGLNRPIFMGCSVGGQLALDLAAHHANEFRGFVGLNAWHDMAPFHGFSNDRFRDPGISQNWYASMCHGATGPYAPEANAQETYWIYRSNFPGVYAGDNDYFISGHDLRLNGQLIDGSHGTVYVVNGSYDPSVAFDEHGGAAVARKIPGVVYREMPGLSHFAPSDDPLRFREEIIPILRAIAATR